MSFEVVPNYYVKFSVDSTQKRTSALAVCLCNARRYLLSCLLLGGSDYNDIHVCIISNVVIRLE